MVVDSCATNESSAAWTAALDSASPRVVLIVNHAMRDLTGMVLLSLKLCQHGVTCYLVPFDLQRSEVWRLAPDLVVLNYYRKHVEEFYAQLIRAHEPIGVLDSEGGVFERIEHYGKFLAEDPSLRSAVRFYCCWGAPLIVSDAVGTILGKRTISVAGMRRTPLWSRIEDLLGRPLCTLGDRAACERAAARADVCAARGLPIASPGADLRYLVALGPDRIDPYADDRPGQTRVPVREYFQLLRGSGLHAIGSLAQLADAFGRVIYDPEGRRLAASWFPAPEAGALPDWKCSEAAGRAATVRGEGGGLCAVLRPGGTAHAAAGALLADPALAVYGAKTGTIDSLADIARRPAACAAWNARHDKRSQLACGKTPPDDSLFVIAFGVVTPKGTIPITLGVQLQRSGSGGAARAAPHFVREIAKYLRGG
jgi:hypothetical protein